MDNIVIYICSADGFRAYIGSQYNKKSSDLPLSEIAYEGDVGCSHDSIIELDKWIIIGTTAANSFIM